MYIYLNRPAPGGIFMLVLRLCRFFVHTSYFWEPPLKDHAGGGRGGNLREGLQRSSGRSISGGGTPPPSCPPDRLIEYLLAGFFSQRA